MHYTRMPGSLVNHVIISFCVLQLNAQGIEVDFKVGQSSDCGKVDINPDDVRTTVPWVAAVYSRRNATSEFQFLVTAVVLGPTTVLTVAGGAYGSPARGAKGRYSIGAPHNILIGTGLKSTDLDQRDGHSQISEVRYIIPYNGHEESNKHFHYFLYHLKTPLNLKSPYVRALCLPWVLAGIRGNPFQWVYLQGGFARAEWDESEHLELKALEVIAGTQDECDSAFVYYYKSDPAHVFCGRLTEGLHQGNLCQLHGSVAAFSLNAGNINRWFLAGITSLIPSLRRGKCNNETMYIYGRFINHLDWIYKSYTCSPDGFACRNSTCIPLSSVCNGVKDCIEGSDEEPIYCKAQSRCNSKTKPYQCGVGGKCLKKSQICDGVKNCDDGSDEAVSRCTPQNGFELEALNLNVRNFISYSITSRNSAFSCIGVPETFSDGVLMSCRDPQTNVSISCDEVPIGGRATLHCDELSVPVFHLPTAEIICLESGEWGPKHLAFACEPGCGVVRNSVSDSSEISFPWQATIFRLENERYELFCSATLIESTFLLSSGKCVPQLETTSDSKGLYDEYKVVVAPISENYIKNAKSNVSQIFDIKRTWTSPQSRNEPTLNLIELSQPIRAGFVSPACYLERSFPRDPQPGEFGLVSGFDIGDSGNRKSGSRRLTFNAIVSATKCQYGDGSQIPESTFCVGFEKGPRICKSDFGTGFFQLKKSLGRDRFTLKGISDPPEDSCSSQYSIFVKVEAFEDWLLSILEQEV